MGPMGAHMDILVGSQRRPALGQHRSKVKLGIRSGCLTLDIHDQGTRTKPWRGGVGIASMRERATELGGTLHAVANPTGGHVRHTAPHLSHRTLGDSSRTQIPVGKRVDTRLREAPVGPALGALGHKPLAPVAGDDRDPEDAAKRLLDRLVSEGLLTEQRPGQPPTRATRRVDLGVRRLPCSQVLSARYIKNATVLNKP